MVAITLDVLDEDVDVKNIETWLDAIPVVCYVILLFKHTYTDLVVPIANTFEAHAVVNLVMIAVNENFIYTFHNTPPQAIRHTGYPSPESILYDRLSALKLGEISAAYIQDVYTDPFADTIYGEDIQLFKLFFKKLGMSFTVKETQCELNDSYMQCLNNQRDVVIYVNRFMPLWYSSLLIDSIEMYKYALFVPSGRLLTIMEIFLLPFNIGVWILLGILCVLFYLLHHFVPTLFQNNLFLLALFGWERRSLFLSEQCEKLFGIALIVLVFQLTCVYETVIISSMINRPAKRSPDSIYEFLATNVEVLYNSKQIDIERFNINVHGMDLRSASSYAGLADKAYLGNFISLALLSQDVINIDHFTGRPRHVMLKEFVWESLAFYYFRKRSIFADRFAQFRRRVFEAGFQRHWRQELLMHLARKQQLAYHSMINREENVMKLDKMTPVLKMLFIAWGASVSVFFIENCVFMLKIKYHT
uniref:Ionotropic glutamate receptor C-terminal domain-containing protein n=1 Tax=Anopheles culicifacies TaxID=139723 RepID=A0A2C9GUN3_9DIPT